MYIIIRCHDNILTEMDSPNVNFQKDQKTLIPIIKMNYLGGNCFVNLSYTQVNHQESIIYGNNTYVILVLKTVP
jgi:hypothetical protein